MICPVCRNPVFSVNIQLQQLGIQNLVLLHNNFPSHCVVEFICGPWQRMLNFSLPFVYNNLFKGFEIWYELWMKLFLLSQNRVAYVSWENRLKERYKNKSCCLLEVQTHFYTDFPFFCQKSQIHKGTFKYYIIRFCQILDYFLNKSNPQQ